MALTKQQLIARKQGIGGSDAAAILGLSQWKSPLDIFFDKLDTGEPEQINTPFTEWGIRLESAIVHKFQDKTEFLKYSCNKLFTSFFYLI